MKKRALIKQLHIKPKVHYIAILCNILFTFQMQFTSRVDGASYKIFLIAHFCSNKTAHEIFVPTKEILNY